MTVQIFQLAAVVISYDTTNDSAIDVCGCVTTYTLFFV